MSTTAPINGPRSNSQEPTARTSASEVLTKSLLAAFKGMDGEQLTRIWSVLAHECTEGMMICDASSRILYVNPAFEGVTGYSRDDVLGQTPRILHSGRQSPDFYRRMWDSLQVQGTWRSEIWNRRKTGELYAEWLSIAAVRRDDGAVSHYVGVFSDLTQRKQAEERVRRLTQLDALTLLPNRANLIASLEELMSTVGAAHDAVALMIVDLDRFRSINLSLTHQSGDAVLQAIGRRIASVVRRSDIVARLGADEFAIALPSSKDLAGVEHLSQVILAEIAKPLEIGEIEVEVSASLGFCQFPQHAHSASEMISNAEAAVRLAKSDGGRRWRAFDATTHHTTPIAFEMEAALRRALRDDEFELYYQPQIDVRSGVLIGVEALLRWNRPGVGIVSPGEFIPIAEEQGLICEIGEWALRAAVRQAALWEREGLPPFSIAVNVSATQFHRHGWSRYVEETIAAANLSPHRIELEITEGVILENTAATVEILQRLHDFGVVLSIDDFGTGYSSLSYLRRFPVDLIKIDRSFVLEMSSETSATGIVRGIIELARSLKLRVVAEGVETADQLSMLQDLRCDRAQGFFIARPMRASKAEYAIRHWDVSRFNRRART